MKIAQFKSKEAKLAFDLAIHEIPSLEEELVEAISLCLDYRKAGKLVRKAVPEDKNDASVAAVATKFRVLFLQIIDLEEECARMGIESRKFFKVSSDLIRLKRTFEKSRDLLEDRAADSGFDLKTVCGFLYQER